MEMDLENGTIETRITPYSQYVVCRLLSNLLPLSMNTVGNLKIRSYSIYVTLFQITVLSDVRHVTNNTTEATFQNCGMITTYIKCLFSVLTI